jgi:hypothetical protein
LNLKLTKLEKIILLSLYRSILLLLLSYVEEES